jgi:hypothetical protein
MGDGATIVLLVAALPGLIVLGMWMWRRPVRLLAAYFAVLPFGSAIALPLPLPRSFSTLSSLLGLATGVAYIWHWIDQRPSLRIPSLSLPIWILYSALAVASVAWSIRARVTVDNLLVLASLVGLFTVVVVTPIAIEELKELRAWIAAGGGITGLYALALAATGNMTTTGAGLPRFEITGAGGGEGGDPNITAAALVMPIAIALWEGLNPQRSRRSRFWFMAAAVLAGMAALLTASRGGFLSLAIVALVTVVTHRRGAWSIFVIAVVVLPAALLLPSTFQERVDNTGSTGRTAIWRLAIESCPEYCQEGSGFGTFADVHETAFLSYEGATGTKIRYQAHSIWFESLIELGVAGFSLLLIALGVTVRDLLRSPLDRRGGALAGLLGLLAANTFLSNLTFKYFWLGLTYAVLVVAADDRPAEVSGVLSRQIDR